MNKETELLYPELSYQLQGCLFNVYNGLGFGHKEVVYQRALAEEFAGTKLAFEREPMLPIYYNGKKVGEYRPDFDIDHKIVLEIKAL